MLHHAHSATDIHCRLMRGGLDTTNGEPELSRDKCKQILLWIANDCVGHLWQGIQNLYKDVLNAWAYSVLSGERSCDWLLSFGPWCAAVVDEI